MTSPLEHLPGLLAASNARLTALESRGAERERENGALRDELRAANARAEHAEYDRGILAKLEGMFEAVGPDLVEAVAALREQLDRAEQRIENLQASHEHPRLQDVARIGELEKLLARCIRYAREDRMVTPGGTRLARALAQAERAIQTTSAGLGQLQPGGKNDAGDSPVGHTMPAGKGPDPFECPEAAAGGEQPSTSRPVADAHPRAAEGPWTCWRCGPRDPHAIDSQHERGGGCGACEWTGVDLQRYLRQNTPAPSNAGGGEQKQEGARAAGNDLEAAPAPAEEAAPREEPPASRVNERARQQLERGAEQHSDNPVIPAPAPSLALMNRIAELEQRLRDIVSLAGGA